MPNLDWFQNNKSKRNAYYRKYRKKNLKKLRKYHKVWMRRFRKAKKKSLTLQRTGGLAG